VYLHLSILRLEKLEMTKQNAEKKHIFFLSKED
jgi:hypothetical protein